MIKVAAREPRVTMSQTPAMEELLEDRGSLQNAL